MLNLFSSKFILVLFALSFPFGGFSAETDSSCSQQTRWVDGERRLQVTVPDGEGGWRSPRPDELCDERNSLTQVMKAIHFLIELDSLNDRRDEFNHGFIDQAPFQYLLERAEEIQVSREGAASLSCSRGRTLAFFRRPKSIEVCPYAGEFSALLLSSMLLHEARHADDHPHVACRRGHLKTSGGLSCDPSYTVGGSFGITAEYLVRVTRTSHLPLKIREEARTWAVSILLERFNETPVGIEPGLLLQFEDGELSFYNGHTHLVLAQNLPSKAVLTHRVSLPTLLHGPQVRSLVGRSRWTDTRESNFVKIYKQESLAGVQSQLVDAFFNDIQCYLLPNLLHCEKNGETAEVELPEGLNPKQFMVLGSGSSGPLLQIVTDENHYSLPLTRLSSAGDPFPGASTQPLSSWSFNDLRAHSSFRGFKSHGSFDGTGYAVSTSGELVSRQNAEWLPVEPFRGRRLKKIFGPFWWSPRFDQL